MSILPPLVLDKKPLDLLENIRVDRNAIFNFEEIKCPQFYELSYDVVLFLNNLVQTKSPDLYGCYHFTTKDFLSFSGRSNSSIYSLKDDLPALIDSDNEAHIVNTSLEYVLRYYAITALNVSTVYKFADKELVSYAGAFLLKSFNMFTSNDNTKKRNYWVELNGISLTSMLRQYLYLDPSVIFSLRGRANSLYPLFVLLSGKKINLGIKDDIVIYYPVMKRICNINIVAFSNRSNIVRTQSKIKEMLEIILTKQALNFTYFIDSNNDYHFKFLEDKKKGINKINHKILIAGVLQSVLNNFLSAFCKKTSSPWLLITVATIVF